MTVYSQLQLISHFKKNKYPDILISLNDNGSKLISTYLGNNMLSIVILVDQHMSKSVGCVIACNQRP